MESALDKVFRILSLPFLLLKTGRPGIFYPRTQTEYCVFTPRVFINILSDSTVVPTLHIER